MIVASLACLSVALVANWSLSHRVQYELEEDLKRDSRFYRPANLFFEENYILSDFLLRFMGEDFRERFSRITVLDFRVDDLNSYYEPDDVSFYANFKSVHTIRLDNRFVTPEMLDVFRSFSKLRKIEYCRSFNLQNAYIELDETILPGVTIIHK